MNTWEFELVLSGFSVGFEDAVDALIEAGCDDCTVSQHGTTPVLLFDREAETFEQAILSAIADVEKANVGASVVRVEPDDLVTPADISRRSGLSKEMVRRYIAGERVAMGFPPPVAVLETRSLWSWVEVASFFVSSGSETMRTAERPTIDLMRAKVLAAFNVAFENKRRDPMLAESRRIAELMKSNVIYSGGLADSKGDGTHNE